MMGCGRASWAQLIWALLFAVMVGLSALLVKWAGSNQILRMAVALAPVVPGIVYIRIMVQDLAKLDEMYRRIYLEAVAAAFAGLFLFLMIYPGVQKAGIVGELEPAAVVLVMVALALVGYFFASRRYE